MSHKKKILIVDDEEDLLDFISYNLRKAGYEVFLSTTGKEALEIAKQNKPDLAMLDLMMPDMDGIELCHEIRSNSDIANMFVVFLTARSEDYTQVAIFDAGADDYINKPIKPRLLLKKLQAILNRGRVIFSDNLSEKKLVVDSEKYKVYLGNQEISLPKKEFEILKILTSKPDIVHKREYIFEKVWGDDVIVGDRTIDVHIRKIRSKIGDNFIKTVKGVGYKFEQ